MTKAIVPAVAAFFASLLWFSVDALVGLSFVHTGRSSTTERRAFSELLTSHQPLVALTAQPQQAFQTALDAFDIQEHPFATILGSYLLSTVSDMVPFLPCQPLAVALGAKLGFAYAFPVATAGQTTAGILAFSVARQARSVKQVEQYLSTLNDQALENFRKLQRLTTSDSSDDDKTILLTLAGLRVAPFFPFSAGNYLLGGATAVPLRLFAIATLFGCVASNFLSTSIGAGGAMLLQSG